MNESLVRSIHAVFPDDCPPARPVTGHNCPECDDTDSILGGRVWSEVAADFPAYCHDAFPLLTPAAQVYYLPAYMLAALAPESGLQGTSLETAMTDGRLPREAFTAAQRQVIVQWAKTYWRLVGDVEPPDEVIAYWSAEAS